MPHAVTFFQEVLRELRNARGLGLREFAALVEMDPSNYARFESLNRPAVPTDENLSRIAEGLGLAADSEDRQVLFDTAALARGQIPTDLRENSDAMRQMPQVLQLLRNNQLVLAQPRGASRRGRRSQTG